MHILFFGATGWIGSTLKLLLESEGHTVTTAMARLDQYGELVAELNRYPDLTHVVLAAGLTGRPNVDWCEDHKREVLATNVIGPGILADLTHRRGLHLTYLGTGCIYEYDDKHPIGGPGYLETDKPNFAGSFYSYSKIMTENILKEFPQTLILRIRMPLSDDLHPRSFITKITRYAKVVNIPNSMTVLHDLIPIIPDMMRQGRTGIYNFCNPGVISHNQILDLYRTYIDPAFHYENFSLDEQAKILKAGRSNNCLDVSKLVAEYPQIRPISEAIVGLFQRMQHTLKTAT
jgi:3,5-epimerase/4-reductase